MGECAAFHEVKNWKRIQMTDRDILSFRPRSKFSWRGWIRGRSVNSFSDTVYAAIDAKVSRGSSLAEDLDVAASFVSIFSASTMLATVW